MPKIFKYAAQQNEISINFKMYHCVSSCITYVCTFHNRFGSKHLNVVSIYYGLFKFYLKT